MQVQPQNIKPWPSSCYRTPWNPKGLTKPKSLRLINLPAFPLPSPTYKFSLLSNAHRNTQSSFLETKFSLLPQLAESILPPQNYFSWGKIKQQRTWGKKRREKKHRCRSVTRIEFGDLVPTATKKKKKKKKQGYERSTDGVAARERECAIARVVLDRYGEEEERQRRERSRNQPSTAHFFFFSFQKIPSMATSQTGFLVHFLWHKNQSAFLKRFCFLFFFF